jgi:pantetheine-phosphate adenylyltransferase
MADASRLAVLAGSFDPITNGHVDMIARSAALFDRVVVAVLVNPLKQPLFSAEDRVAMIREAVTGMRTVEVDRFEGLLAEYVRLRHATAVVRGLRTAGEFSEEWPTALMNRHLNPGCETVFVVPAADVMHISARHVREIASLGGSVVGLVPPGVEARLRARFAKRS